MHVHRPKLLIPTLHPTSTSPSRILAPLSTSYRLDLVCKGSYKDFLQSYRIESRLAVGSVGSELKPHDWEAGRCISRFRV